MSKPQKTTLKIQCGQLNNFFRIPSSNDVIQPQVYYYNMLNVLEKSICDQIAAVFTGAYLTEQKIQPLICMNVVNNMTKK